MPPISVIFACYNKGPALKRSLLNTMGQLREGDEVIVSDGGSSDRVERWLARDYPEVDLLRVAEHKPFNLCAVWNQGVRAARNDAIIVFDADVIPQPGCVDALRAEYAPRVFRGGVCIYEVDARYLRAYRKANPGKLTPTTYMVGNYPPGEVLRMLLDPKEVKIGTMGGVMLFSKADWLRIGGFDETLDGYWGYQDTDFILRLHLAGVDVRTIKPRFNGETWEGALGFHQAHGERRGWKLTTMRRNKAWVAEKVKRLLPEA